VKASLGRLPEMLGLKSAVINGSWLRIHKMVIQELQKSNNHISIGWLSWNYSLINEKIVKKEI